MSQLYCPSHLNSDLIEDYRAGDLICSACGLVVCDRLLFQSFPHHYSEVDNKENTTDGSLPEQYIHRCSAQSSGPSVMTTQSNNKKDETPVHRTIAMTTGLGEIVVNRRKREISVKHSDLMSRTVTHRVAQLFKLIVDEPSLQGLSLKAIASACVYMIGGQEGIGLSFDRISIGYKLPVKQIILSYDLILGVITTNTFMSHFCDKLKLSHSIQRAADRIAEQAIDQQLVVGRNPMAVAAAAIYMATQLLKEKRTQKKIRDITGVKHWTFRSL